MEASGRKTRILLVEDNPGDVELLTLALQQSGLEFEFVLVEDGGEALAFLDRPDAGRIDLAIVDLNLPKNDGLEVLAAMRESAVFGEVPIIVFTSSASPRDRARMETFRIAAFLSKPNDLDEYMRIGVSVKEVLSNAARESAHG